MENQGHLRRDPSKELYETTESLNAKTQYPLHERPTNSMPFLAQIQELMCALTQKKNQLRQLKLKQANVEAKSQQQDGRIKDINISMDHEIQKDETLRSQQERLEEAIVEYKECIREISKQVKALKVEATKVISEQRGYQSSNCDLSDQNQELSISIKERSIQNREIDEQIQNLQTLLNTTQNDIRGKQDELTQAQLQKTEIVSLIDYLEEKLKMAYRAKNVSECEKGELGLQIKKCESKVNNLRKQANEVEWNSEQVKSHNKQIEQLNERLESDLEAVKKHLASMEKMNCLLKNSIQDYEITGCKVTRIIHSSTMA